VDLPRHHLPGLPGRRPGQKNASIGFLPNAGSFNVSFCTDANIPANAHCSGRTDSITAVGQSMEVSVTYTYTFYVDPLLGSAGPSIPMTSSARMVGQQ